MLIVLDMVSGEISCEGCSSEQEQPAKMAYPQRLPNIGVGLQEATLEPLARPPRIDDIDAFLSTMADFR